jgi:hypothetical protein
MTPMTLLSEILSYPWILEPLQVLSPLLAAGGNYCHNGCTCSAWLDHGFIEIYTVMMIRGCV